MPEPTTTLPVGFVYLSTVNPDIVQCVRYGTVENFTGSVVPGYSKPKIVCTVQCAEALSKIHEQVRLDGYRLVVYDAYRPQKAVDEFGSWSKKLSEQCQKQKYYPYVCKCRVFELGYIAARSGHSRGSTVDVTLLRETEKIKFPTVEVRQLKENGDSLPFLNDNTMDMGTSFDLFDSASHHDSPAVSMEHTRNRNYLKAAMEAGGFRSLSEEWWHYTLDDEPFKDTYFDFDIS